MHFKQLDDFPLQGGRDLAIGLGGNDLMPRAAPRVCGRVSQQQRRRGPEKSSHFFHAGSASPTFALPRAAGWEVQIERPKTCDQLDSESIDMLHERTCMYLNARSTVVVTGDR